jgi:membrane protease YdiL (CAAX protease family)
MLIWLDHALVILLAAFFPIWAVVFGSRRLRRASAQDLPRVRNSTYLRAMIMLWSLSAVVVGCWILEQRSFGSLGLVPRLTPGLLGVALGAVVIAIALVRERNQTLADDEALARLRERLSYVEPVLPHSRSELLTFYRLSVSAGVCEELLYRGYLIWYLTHWLGFWPAAAIASVLFGLGHSYQGPRGMLITAAVGMFLAAVYWVSGSLFAPMALHAIMDIHSGHLAHAAFEQERLEAEDRWEEDEPADGTQV